MHSDPLFCIFLATNQFTVTDKSSAVALFSLSVAVTVIVYSPAGVAGSGVKSTEKFGLTSNSEPGIVRESPSPSEDIVTLYDVPVVIVSSGAPSSPQAINAETKTRQKSNFFIF